MSAATDIGQAALQVVTDPCLRTVAQQLSMLHETEQTGPTTATGPVTLGIGLCKAVPIINAVIFVKQNPWIAFLTGGTIVGLIFGAGYKLGKRRRG